jgi:hypothetical protein
MKNRTLYLIFCAIYVISFGFGYAFSGLRQANAKSDLSFDPRQANWILVHVDDMTVEQPKLVSVWGLFITFTPGPQLYFKPFYSADLVYEKPPKIAQQFAVKEDRALAEGFLQAIDDLNIRRSGLAILDNEGFNQFTHWFQQPFELASPLVPLTGPVQANVREENAFQDICLTIKSPSLARPVELPWHTLYPIHLISQPSLDSLIDLWSRVVDSNIPPHCEVISSP